MQKLSRKPWSPRSDRKAATWSLIKKFGSPTVTKDGVTVAKAKSNSKTLTKNMGAQMVREVASKTSDAAGDGNDDGDGSGRSPFIAKVWKYS